MIRKKNIGVLVAPRKVTSSDVKQLRAAKKAQMQKQKLTRRKAIQTPKQKLMRRKAIQTQRQKVESAKTPLDRRQARTTLKAMKVDSRLQKAKRRGNTEKAKRLETTIERLAKKNQKIRNKQMEKGTFAKVPSRVTRVTQPPPPRGVVRKQVRRRG